jgi:hypothetical protein
MVQAATVPDLIIKELPEILCSGPCLLLFDARHVEFGRDSAFADASNDASGQSSIRRKAHT